MVHLDRDGVGRGVARQFDIVPISLQVLLAVGGLDGDTERWRPAGTVRDVQGHRLQEFRPLGTTHNERRKHRFTYGDGGMDEKFGQELLETCVSLPLDSFIFKSMQCV